MEEIVKHINNTNASYRDITAGDAKNTDLFLDQDARQFFNDLSTIHVVLHKENLMKSILFISSVLPRKFDSSTSHYKVPFSTDFVYDNLLKLEGLFSDSQTFEMDWNIRTDVKKKNGKVDERFYINGLLYDYEYIDKNGDKVKEKFTIRDYLAGGYSDIHIVRTEHKGVFDVYISNTSDYKNTTENDGSKGFYFFFFDDDNNDTFIYKHLLKEKDNAVEIMRFAVDSFLNYDSNFDMIKDLLKVNPTTMGITGCQIGEKASIFDAITVKERKEDCDKRISWIFNGEKYYFYNEQTATSFKIFANSFNEFYKDKFLIDIAGNDYLFYELIRFASRPLQEISYGAPGTGKSHGINKRKENQDLICHRITFHPDTDYASFVGCYKPIYDKKENIIKYQFRAQAFLNTYFDAWKNPSKKYALVIEEINRGNCAQIFGDIFQLLDRRKDGFSEYPIIPDADIQEIMKDHLPSYYKDLIEELYNKNDKIFVEDGSKVLTLPPNMSILATMNTSDQSLFPMDSAFKRRWDWEYVPIDYAQAKEYNFNVGSEEKNWGCFLKAINDQIAKDLSSCDKQIGHRFVKLDDKDKKPIGQEVFVNKVLFYLFDDVYKDDDKFGKLFVEETNEAFFFENLIADKAKEAERINHFLDRIHYNEIEAKYKNGKTTAEE